jgi:hypothetical protein
MNREIWEFLAGGDPVIKKWLENRRLSARDQAKLDLFVDRLRTLDFHLVSSKWMALVGGKIYKLRLRCEDRELRPMLCRGPLRESPLDYTLLEGAVEVGGHLEPRDARERADKNRSDLIQNPKLRRLY